MREDQDLSVNDMGQVFYHILFKNQTSSNEISASCFRDVFEPFFLSKNATHLDKLILSQKDEETNGSAKKIYPYIKNTVGEEYSFRKNMESVNVSQYDKFV